MSRQLTAKCLLRLGKETIIVRIQQDVGRLGPLHNQRSMSWGRVPVDLSSRGDSEIVEVNMIVAAILPLPRCYELGAIFESVALFRRTIH
jgi:hypothetical protein